MPSAQSVLIKLACEARVPSNDRYHRKLTFNLGRVNDTLLDSATTGRSRPDPVVHTYRARRQLLAQVADQL